MEFEDISTQTGLSISQLEDAANVIKVVSSRYELTASQLIKTLTRGAQGDTRQRVYQYRVCTFDLPWRNADPLADTDPQLKYGNVNPKRTAVGLRAVLAEACELLSAFHGRPLDRAAFYSRQGTLRSKLSYHGGEPTHWAIDYVVRDAPHCAVLFIAPVN